MARQSHVFTGVSRHRGGSRSGVFRHAVGGGGWELLEGGLPAGANAHCVTVDPNDPDTVYVGMQDGAYRTTDGGAKWTKLALPDSTEIWSFLVHPKKPRTLFAGASPVAVYRSDDGGERWRKLPPITIPLRIKMAFDCRVMRFAVDPAQDDTIYATVEVNGVIRSRDGGESWEDCSAGLIKFAEDEPHLKSKIGSDNEREGMLDGHALVSLPSAPGNVIVAVRMGLFKSADGGAHWEDMRVHRFSPVTYGRDIRVSPHDPKVLYACLSIAASSDHGRVYRSADVGATWQRFDEGLKAGSTMMAVTPSPRDPNQVFCTSRKGEVFGTLDGGKSWKAMPLPDGCSDVYAIACS
ncbi:MAG: hypothetical protein JO021_16340 [Alphaproteobacteria bacterium]|nr:hypothetical protein [Alphaproteobacteria bacterium]